jgi:hypothetical protein
MPKANKEPDGRAEGKGQIKCGFSGLWHSRSGCLQSSSEYCSIIFGSFMLAESNNGVQVEARLR